MLLINWLLVISLAIVHISVPKITLFISVAPCVTLDEKCLQIQNVIHVGISQSVAYFYPKMIQLVSNNVLLHKEIQV